MRKGIIKAFLIITLTILFPFSLSISKVDADLIGPMDIGGTYGVPQIPGQSTLCIQPGTGGITNVESSGSVPKNKKYCKYSLPEKLPEAQLVPNGQMYYQQSGGGSLSAGLAFALSQGGDAAQLAAWNNLGAFGSGRWNKRYFCSRRWNSN